MNDILAHRVIREALKCGVTEFCICPGARNSPFIFALDNHPQIKTYSWFEERSAAFFALGRSIALNRPVAVITTSGTAVGELLPAAMEAYYTGIPLLLITADRPRRFRGTGAPQAAEQASIFGCYASFSQDLALDEPCDLSGWPRQQPAHVNVCIEEPGKTGVPFIIDSTCQYLPIKHNPKTINETVVDEFLKHAQSPLVVVSTLKSEARDPVCAFLLSLNAPVLLEATSGLREDPRLRNLRVTNPEKIFNSATNSRYEIDGVLRIGGVPTNRLWRDLEDLQGKVDVCSINDNPFSGLSWGNILHGDVAAFFSHYRLPKIFNLETAIQDHNVTKDFEYKPLALMIDHSQKVKAAPNSSDYSSKDCVNPSSLTTAPRFNSPQAAEWLETDHRFHQRLVNLFAEEPHAEASLIHSLSSQISPYATVYLGNSLPIREWDLAASLENKDLSIYASRGLNGIDGQLSTFFGFCSPANENWAVIGDLTALYDMAGPWILSQLDEIRVNIVIINNSGGQIFSRMFPSQAFLNRHDLNFAPLAELWGLSYEKWTTVPDKSHPKTSRLIEIVPDPKATERFWKKLNNLEGARGSGTNTKLSANLHSSNLRD